GIVKLNPVTRDDGGPDALFGNQAGPLENGDVLLDGREAHRVVAGELDDALVGGDRAAHDVAASVVRKSAEHAIEVTEGGRRALHEYNHMVVPSMCQHIQNSCRKEHVDFASPRSTSV